MLVPIALYDLTFRGKITFLSQIILIVCHKNFISVNSMYYETTYMSERAKFSLRIILQ